MASPRRASAHRCTCATDNCRFHTSMTTPNGRDIPWRNGRRHVSICLPVQTVQTFALRQHQTPDTCPRDNYCSPNICPPPTYRPPGHRPVTIVYHVAITFKSRVGAIVRGQLLKGGIRPGAHVLGADVREGATVRWQMSYLHLYCIACCRHVTRHDSALRGAAVDV